MRSLTMAAVLASLVLPAYAWKSPRQALDEFLKYELNGGRLDGSNWATYVTKYIAAPEDYDEPGWDELTIIRSWRVISLQCPSKQRCIAKVAFSLLPTRGLDTSNVVRHDMGGTQMQSYQLVVRNDDWRVAPEFGSPRISEAAYCHFLRKTGKRQLRTCDWTEQ